MRILVYSSKYTDIDLMLVNSCKRSEIIAAISSRDIAKDLVRVKSSNVWAYGMNVKNRGDKTGDIIAQFKGADGGPTGGTYIYYDVPIDVYRRWVSAPSKGSYFWKYIRNNYRYSKLDGDRRGKLPNAINSR